MLWPFTKPKYRPGPIYTVDDYRAKHPADRAAGAIHTLKALDRYSLGMTPRELTDEEVMAGILLGTIDGLE
jgi:hypothetical protein